MTIKTKPMTRKALHTFLDTEVQKRLSLTELVPEKPDPLMVARTHMCEYRSLVCALYAYGNAKAIVTFLSSLDFSFLERDEEAILTTMPPSLYRFQTAQDTAHFFVALSKLKKISSLESVFLSGYDKKDVRSGIKTLIDTLKKIHPYQSHGYDFLVGNTQGNSPLKRWNMFLRWMVRDDGFDMGLWKNVDTQDLIMPLDTHTFHVGKKLHLITRKTYDMKAAIELTNSLKKFDPLDPVKYDFALYRLGQEGSL